ncbi:hypothetical protein [Pseudoalteromonas tunicata]|uniref:hypothetical protein n=1 Tax=Pseudoalteromonas tunicata TaxID=314281 RepID=UPI00273F8250|nr:hypothetical protein [Pseudoalteromonas tunicata]MDP4984243.1 hypothetical protein [Pseudoalteromonas tunicata]
MFLSIQTIANKVAIDTQISKKDANINHQGALTKFTDALDNASVATGVLDANVKHEIPDSTRTLYKKITDKVTSELDVRLNSREKAISYSRNSIDAILNEPIEVEMTPQDLKRAIIFARLGIDYEKVKELEAKIDLLTLAKEEIEQSIALTATDKAALLEQIEEEQTNLNEKIEALMKGHEGKELDALEQVLYGKQANGVDLLANLQQASEYHLQLRAGE